MFFIVRTFTRASLAQRVAFVVMLCQFRIDELEAAARVSRRRNHRTAARRRRMLTNGSPTGRLRSRAVRFVLGFGFCVGVWTMHRPGGILLGICYILTKVEAASREAMRAGLGPANSICSGCKKTHGGRQRPRESGRGQSLVVAAAHEKFSVSSIGKSSSALTNQISSDG